MPEEIIIPTSKPEVRPTGTGNRFYVYAEALKGEWRVQAYLHVDGVWRESAYHDDRATGYFNTQMRAQQILKRFIFAASPATTAD